MEDRRTRDRASLLVREVYVYRVHSKYEGTITHRLGGMALLRTRLWLAHNERVALSRSARRNGAVESYYVPMFGRLFGAQGANIRGLGGKTRHCTGCGNMGI